MTTRALDDTSVFIADETGRTLDASAIPDELAVSVITIGELRAGVLAAADWRVDATRRPPGKAEASRLELLSSS